VDVAYPPGVSVEENRQAAQIDMENSQQEAIAAALSYLDIPFTSRLEINQALEGGPSEGVLLAGDIITSANGILVSDVTQLRDIIAASGAQSPLPLVLERDGQVVEMQVIPRMSEGEARMPMIGILVSGLYDFPIDIEIALDNVGGPSAGLMFALGIVDKLAAEDITGGAVVAGTGVINADGEVGSIGGIRHKLYGARDDGATVFFAPEANCADIGGRIPEGLQVIPVATLDDALGALRALRSGGSVPQCPSP
jgi:PDZ domain-containing protein